MCADAKNRHTRTHIADFHWTFDGMVVLSFRLNATDNEALTPLHWAARSGHTATAEALLAAGAG